jgi:AAA family ATP:ADP antiporter
VSVFWALIVDTFNSEQGKRLFGFIAAGATIGAITGSSITATFARHVPTPLLLAGAIILLEVAVFSVRHLSRLSEALNARPHEALGSPVGGNVLAGITHPFKSAYLANVSLFILLFAITATFLYFQQASLVRDNFHDRGAQTAFFAQVDLAVNVITLVVQLFFTGRIVGILGVGLTLAILPALTLLGFGALAALPAVSTLVVFQVLRRSSDYAIARPTREVLYTVVPREDRYKAKSFIDTVVYRGGDQIGAWAYALIAMAGFGSTLMATIAIGLAAVWLLNGLWLGRRQALLAKQED